MYELNIDCVSVKEIREISHALGKEFWDHLNFRSKERAIYYGKKAKEIAPHCEVTIAPMYCGDAFESAIILK